MSSAYELSLAPSTKSGKSTVKMLNRVGDRGQPCRAPTLKTDYLDRIPSISTTCLLFVRKLRNHSTAVLLNFKILSFLHKISLSIMSKAALISSMAMHDVFFLKKFSFHLINEVKSAVVVLRNFLNPC